MTAHKGWGPGSGTLQARAQTKSFQSSGFELSYLEKVSEVKDTVRRQSLLHHLCSLVLQMRPDSSDLYSEIPALTRCAKVSTSRGLNKTGQDMRECCFLGLASPLLFQRLCQGWLGYRCLCQKCFPLLAWLHLLSLWVSV